MPYTKKTAPVKDVLPDAALTLWVSTFNSVLKDTGDEDTARRAAWSNVKKAGYRKGDGDKWVKAESAVVPVEELRLLDRTAALALPTATPTKVYAEFRLLRFGIPNDNQDGFRAEAISDEVVDALVGSPIYVDTNLDEHPNIVGRATQRARFQGGTVVEAEKREDGIWCIGAYQREVLEDRGVDAKRLHEYSVSMEVIFDRTTSEYGLADRTIPYHEALAEGIASAPGTPDDRSKYQVRWITPLEFHAVATLVRGRNADKGADIMRVAASGEDPMPNEVPWAESDIVLYEAHLAELTDEATAADFSSKARKNLRRSQFAYVDEDGEGHLPIHDAAHAKNTLARLNQTDIPADAKQKALKKILAACKRLGVKVDPESDVVKRYGAEEESVEDKLSRVGRAFQAQYGHSGLEPCGPNAWVRATYDDYIIAESDGKCYQIPHSTESEDIDFGKPVEVEVVYKAKGATMAENEKPAAPTAEEFEKAVEAKAKELLDAQRPEIEKAAVDAYKAAEARYAERLRELDEIAPIADGEKSDLEAKVREADDVAYAAMKIARYDAALKKAREEKAAASKEEKTPVVPATLRPGAKDEPPADPFDVRPIN